MKGVELYVQVRPVVYVEGPSRREASPHGFVRDLAIALDGAQGETRVGDQRDTFRQLERVNRRRTVELVAALVVIYAACGFALDLLVHRYIAHITNRELSSTILPCIPWITIAAVAFVLVEALWAYYRGSSFIIASVHCHDPDADSLKEKTVLDVVNELAVAARIPPPRLAIMEDPAPNAFACGRDPDHAVVCVTRGLIDQLDREELQGVLAHELAHIRGRDTALTQMTVVIVSGLSMLSGYRAIAATQVRSPGDRYSHSAVPGIGIIALPLLVVGGLGWLFSKIVEISLSREREYLADAAAVEFTRNPTALIRALQHIAGSASPLKQSLRGVAPLFIVDPIECGNAGAIEFLDKVASIQAQPDKTKEQRDAEIAALIARGTMPQLSLTLGAFSSHPPIRDRIARLYSLQHQPGAQTLEQIDERRKAAAKAVSDAARTNPDVAAAVLASFLPAAEQFNRMVGADVGDGPSDSDPTSEERATFRKPSDQEAYNQLYRYNLQLTGQRPGSHGSGLPFDALLGGEQLGPIDHAKLRDAIALAMAQQQKHSAKADTASNPRPSSRKGLYLFWFVIAVSAGAIFVSFAIR